MPVSAWHSRRERKIIVVHSSLISEIRAPKYIFVDFEAEIPRMPQPMEHRLLHRWYGNDPTLYSDDLSGVPQRSTIVEPLVQEDPVIQYWKSEIATYFQKENMLRNTLQEIDDEEHELINGTSEFQDVEHEIRILEIDRRDINKRIACIREKCQQLQKAIQRFGGQ